MKETEMNACAAAENRVGLNRRKMMAKKTKTVKSAKTGTKIFNLDIDKLEPMPLWAKIMVVALLALLASKLY